jgi:hypothetical protein
VRQGGQHQTGNGDLVATTDAYQRNNLWFGWNLGGPSVVIDMLEKGGERASWGVDSGEVLRLLVYEDYILQSVESFIWQSIHHNIPTKQMECLDGYTTKLNLGPCYRGDV